MASASVKLTGAGGFKLMQIDATGISLLGSTQLQVLPLTQAIIAAMTHNAKQMQCFFDEDPTPAETAAKQPTLHDENRDDVPATQSAKKKSALRVSLKHLKHRKPMHSPCRSLRVRS